MVLLVLLPLACTGAPDVDDGASIPAEPEPGELAPPAVVIDGRFDDWDEGSEARFSIRDDPRAVYLAIPLPTVDNVQGLDGALLLVLDTDDDQSTGTRAFDLPGADLVVSFTRILGEGDTEGGIAWWEPAPDDPDRVALPPEAGDPYGIGLWFEPRHAADRVEVRLARDRPGPESWAAGGFAGRMLLVDTSGEELGGTPTFRHDFRSAPNPAGVPPVADLDRPPATDFRVVSWNVSGGRLLADPGAARGILAALSPDLVLLDEVPPGASTVDIEAVLPGSARDWVIHVGTSGIRQRGVVAARARVIGADAFGLVPYPDTMPPRLEDTGVPTLMEVARSVGGGVPAAGAWVVLGDRDLLAVTLDLVCCGNSTTSVQDLIRRIEAEAINGAATAALEAGRPNGSPGEGPGDTPARDGEPAFPVVVGGDFNLVGSRAPLDLVAAGLGPGGADLSEVYALQLDGATSATWSSPGVPFPPGQLDYVLYSPELLTPVRSFVFETADLPSAQLAGLGLEPGDSDRASDHLPIVVDFVWRTPP